MTELERQAWREKMNKALEPLGYKMDDREWIFVRAGQQEYVDVSSCDQHSVLAAVANHYFTLGQSHAQREVCKALGLNRQSLFDPL
jgi:hypothetical protein